MPQFIRSRRSARPDWYHRPHGKFPLRPLGAYRPPRCVPRCLHPARHLLDLRTTDELWVSAPLADGEMRSGLTWSQLIEDGRFDVTTPEGNRVVRLEGLEASWSLESVLYRRRNVINIPFELQSGGEPERVRLVLTDQGSRLTWMVHDQNDHPITDRAVIALPVNPTFRHSGSRHVRLSYPDLSGRYDVSDLPAGVHLVAALSGIQEGDLHDASMFQETAAAGAEGAIETGMVSRFDVQITR